MIKYITITNPYGEELSIPMNGRGSTGFNIRSIDGLGPVKASINTKDLSSSDGSLYNSAHVGERNIVLTLGYFGLFSMEDARLLTYKYFPLKQKVKFEIQTDNRKAYTYGYVEANSPEIFSQDETYQISLICENPYFISSTSNGTMTSEFSTLVNQFEFPFENESTTDPTLNFGEIYHDLTKEIKYIGDSPTGMLINIKAYGPATKLRIYNATLSESMAFDIDKLESITGSKLVAGDELIISTISGNKYIRLQRNGVFTNVLNILTQDSDWLTLQKGVNIMAYSAETGDTNLQVRVENPILYEGV